MTKIDMTPVACLVIDERGLPCHVATDQQAAHDHISDAINAFGIDEAVEWMVRDVFSAAQLQQARDDAYLLGFKASGEGWNGEYPFGDNGKSPETREGWVNERNAKLKESP